MADLAPKSPLILYGSQTGNAEAIAQMVHTGLVAIPGLPTARISTMAAYVKQDKELNTFRTEQVVIVICSTTGQGDIPDNARPFYRQLRKLPAGSLTKLHIAVLGLGDSNYDKFNNAAKSIERALVELGAQRFIKSVYADDGIGLEIAVEPWRKEIFPAVTTLYSSGALASSEVKSHDDPSTNDLVPTPTSISVTQPVAPLSSPTSEITEEKKHAGVASHLSAAHVEVAVAQALSTAAAQGAVVKAKADVAREIAIQQAALAAASRAAEVAVTSGKFTPIPGFVYSRNAFTAKPAKVIPLKPPKLPKAQPLKLVAYPLFPTTMKDEESGSIGLLPPFPESIEVRAQRLREAGRLLRTLIAPTFITGQGKLDFGFAKQHAHLLHLGNSVDEVVDHSPEDDPNQSSNGSSKLNSSATPESASQDPNGVVTTSNSADARPSAVFGERSLNGYTAEAPSFAEISGARVLTTAKSHENGRQVLHVEFSLPVGGRDSVAFEPGDCIGLFPTNDPALVSGLIQRLGLAGHEDILVHVLTAEQAQSAASTDLSTAMQQPQALPHVPSPMPLKDLFEYCVDLCSIPRKGLIRGLAEYCEDPLDAAKLMSLCSLEGKALFKAYIEETRPNILELLQLFPSCVPPLALLLEHLPPLGPRSYSITNSPNTAPAKVQIAFTVHVAPGVPLKPVPYPSYLHSAMASGTGTVVGTEDTSKPLTTPNVDVIPPEPVGAVQPVERDIKGVCTHWLRRLCVAGGYLQADLDSKSAASVLDGYVPGCAMSLPTSSGSYPKIRVPLFLRRTPAFKLPYDITTPLILVGPGTGVAPFRAFLQHRESELKSVALGGAAALGTWRGMELDICPSRATAQTSESLVNPFASATMIVEGKEGVFSSTRSVAGSTSPTMKMPCSAAEPSEILVSKMPIRLENEDLCRIVIGSQCAEPPCASRALGSSLSHSRSTGHFGELLGATRSSSEHGVATDGSTSSQNTRISCAKKPRGRYEAFDEYEDVDVDMIGTMGDDVVATDSLGLAELAPSQSPTGPRVGPALLFFGCRAADEDAIYFDEFERLMRGGALTTMHIAFSREFVNRGGRKTYVQDVMLAESASVCEYLLKQHAILYVCGDGVELPRSVLQTMQACLEQQAERFTTKEDLGVEELTPEIKKSWAQKTAQRLVREGKFVTDVWN